MVKVVLADSSELIRVGLKTILSAHPDIEVVGEAADRLMLKQQARDLSPDVIMIDYSCPAFTIDAIPEILAQNSRVKFVAITQNQSGLSIINAVKSGVTSYVKKDCDLAEIVDAVRETAHGKKFFCGTILELIRAEAINIENISSDTFTCAPVTLSERELEIIALIAEGYTNQQIAEKLFLSAHTVNTHRKNIMSKLGVNNTAGIVMYAVKSQLVSPNKYLFAPQ